MTREEWAKFGCLVCDAEPKWKLVSLRELTDHKYKWAVEFEIDESDLGEVGRVTTYADTPIEAMVHGGPI